MVKTVKTLAALLLAFGVLTTASAALAQRSDRDEVQAPRGDRIDEVQAPRGHGTEDVHTP